MITQDEDWCSVIEQVCKWLSSILRYEYSKLRFFVKDDEVMPNSFAIVERVLDAHHVREQDGEYLSLLLQRYICI